MRIYYNETTECCVMELPATIDQQDAGTYYCDVDIRNAESDELNLRANETVTIPEPNPTTHGPPVLIIVGSVAGGIVLLLMTVGVFGLVLYKHRQPDQLHNHGYVQVDGEGKEFVYRNAL